MNTIFINVADAQDKASLLKSVTDPLSLHRSQRVRVVRCSSFQSIPRSPFAYWVHPRLLGAFGRYPSFEHNGRVARMGLTSNHDFRFVRLWWECPLRHHIPPFAKGGSFSRFYADITTSIRWTNGGHQLKAFSEQTPGTTHWSRNIRSPDFYFRSGATWTLRTSKGLSVRAMQSGSVFGHKGPAAFVDGDQPHELLSLLAVMNSRCFQELVALQLAAVDAAARSYEVGVLQATPIPSAVHESAASQLSDLALRAWTIKRFLDTRVESSHAFKLPAILQASGASVGTRASAWQSRVAEADRDLVSIQSLIDDCCFDLYGVSEEDRHSITKGVDASLGAAEEPQAEGAYEDDDEEENEDEAADVKILTAELVAWAVGVAAGRFDIRLATRQSAGPPEPCPFDPMPLCSLGMLTGNDGLPLSGPPADYPFLFSDHGVLVDDPGHPLDMTLAVRQVLENVFGAQSDANWREVSEILDPIGHNLRTWLAESFFEFHIKRYSKSRRKAPIYWQLGVPSGRYSVWLYAHRVSKDRLFQVLKDTLQPKLNQEEGVLGRLKQEAGGSPTQSQRKVIESQEDFIAELRTLIDDVARVAPMWAPDLDDGVVICLAPLWRLFPQHKTWQKECKRVWDKLVDGDYDWAHMAMHLWPERVVPKCVTDRSLAIAHGLEEIFWVEVAGRWRALKAPKEEIEVQKRLRKRESSDRLRDALIALSKSSHAAIPSRKLWQAMKQGSLDDQSVSLCLWPERAVERAAANSAVADRLEINSADLATSRARAALIAKYEVAELPSMLAAVEAAFGDDRDFKLLWAALAGGQHDDQSLALILWPERVIEKCLKDAELADKHGLRCFFWVQDLATQQWRRRLAPEDEVKQEMQRRFNRTVKDALAKFIEAPTAEGASSRRRRGGAAAAEVGAGAQPTTQGKKRGRPRTVDTEEELF